MMKTRYTFFATIIFAGFIYGCKPEIEIPAPASGSINSSSYVAIGNSLTAGYSDDGLYREVQVESFPSLIARQLKEINPELVFNQPLMPAGNGSGHLVLNNLDLNNMLFDIGYATPDQNWKQKVQGPFQNLGVPGIRVKDITVAGYGASTTDGNPYFYRMLSEQEAMNSYLDIVENEDITVYTCWMGNNDVLGYAASGGAYGIEGEPVTGLNGLTPVNQFEASFGALMNVLNNKSAKGVLATIPDVTVIPYFNTVSWDQLELTADQAEQANQSYESQLDPQIKAGVKAAVINLVATDTVLSIGVLPDLADTAVYQQAYAQAIAGGADPATAMQIASDYVDSPEGQAQSAALEAQLNAELPAHLQGQQTSPELDPLFDIIDEELTTNADLQQAISSTVMQITTSYDNGILPELQAAVDQQTAAQITALKNAGYYPVFEAGPNGFVIEVPFTPANPLGIRQMVEGELVLFTAVAAGELNPDKAAMPKPDQYILTLDEIDNIDSYRLQYNSIIKGYQGADIAVIDMDAVLNKYVPGTFIDGVNVDGSYIQGGIFSLDAVHLTPRGYAIIANEFINTLNSSFNASVPPVNISDYRPVELP